MFLETQDHSAFHTIVRRLMGIFVIVTIGACVYWEFSPKPLLSEVLQPTVPAVDTAPRSESEQLIINAYKRANKAVVNISTRAEVLDFYGPTEHEGSGSGVIIDKDRALVITNAHVIAGGDQIAVNLASGVSYGVKVIGFDVGNDIALLQLQEPPSDLVSAPLGDSSTLEVGQHVLAIGNPFGLQRTLTDGIISSLGRSIRAENGSMIQDVIQTDAAINPGNSGGPLLDTAGKVVGLNTAIVSSTGQNAGIGFAVPINQIKAVIPQLIKYGKVLRPQIGAIITDTDYGPVVLQVQPDSPADLAGLSGARQRIQRGFFSGYVVNFAGADFVLSVNGKEVRSKDELMDEINKAGTEHELVLVVRRGGDKTRTVKIKPVLS